MNKYIKDILASSSLPLMLLLVAPITMFLGNRDEYDVGFQIVSGLIVVFVAASAMMFVALRVADLNTSVYRIVTGVLLGLSLTVWVQSQLLVWDFGPLDGRGLEWWKFATMENIELAVWGALIPMVVFFSYKNDHFLRYLTIGLPLLGLASMGATYATSYASEESKAKGEYKTIDGSLAFHKQNNTLVIILDSYQSDAFKEILDKHPHEAEFLEGFHFFPDTVAGYATTKHSIPLILTGKFYKNDFPWTKRTRADFFSESLAYRFEREGFGVTGTFSREFINTIGRQAIFPPWLSDFKYFGFSGAQIRALDIGIFRAAPIVIKKDIYDEGRWFLSKFRTDKGAPPEPHGSDWRFVNAFKAHANTTSEKAGEFKFIHLIGAHYPLSINENYEYVRNIEDTRAGYVNQARGALKLTRDLIGKLKELGIYEDAEILIAADHGSHNKKPIDMKGAESDVVVPVEHLGAARPLFLYKAAGAKGSLKIDNTPMHLAYIPCLLEKSTTSSCQDYKKAVSGQLVVRNHYRYDWSHEFWFKDFSPTMTLYEVRGDSRNYTSWKNTGRTFSEVKGNTLKKYALGKNPVSPCEADKAGNCRNPVWGLKSLVLSATP